MRKIAEHLASIANPEPKDSHAKEGQEQGTEKGHAHAHEGDEGHEGQEDVLRHTVESIQTVTSKETGRSSSHVFVTGFFPDGSQAYVQMIPKADFVPSRFIGQFQWGGKVIDV